MSEQDHDPEFPRARLELYKVMIASGDVEQFALQLARKPDDVRAVVQLQREERDEERGRTAEFVTRLIDSGAIDRWDVDDHVRMALEWLRVPTPPRTRDQP